MSNFVLPLLGIIASSLILLVLFAFVIRETQRSRSLDRRLAEPRNRVDLSPADTVRQALHSNADHSLQKIGFSLLRAGSMLVPIGAKEREKLAQMLRKAGFDQQEALSLFLSVKLASAFFLGTSSGFTAAQSTMIGQFGFLIALVAMAGMVVGGIVPEYGMRALIARRLRRMSSALPDALDLMVMCLESGLTFERALATVADELVPIEPNLANEFRLIDAELRHGSDRRAVLQEYYRRTEVDGLRDLAMTLIQGERYGTPLSQSMKNIATGERVQRAARIAAQAERLPVFMTLPMLLFVVPGTMLLVAGPAFLNAIKALGSLGG